uniref:Mab-21-like HhH/H2TH-like domain-containing protein n=2 Tax=Trichogramma kaykai TaxID=54128 RepID=A0ABD2XDQ4_9HYME
MGCSASSNASTSSNYHNYGLKYHDKNVNGSPGLRLMASKLHFKLEQLEKLNHYFSEIAKSDYLRPPDIISAEATVERLVQRLVAGVGNIDRRFSSAFLVSLNDPRKIKQLKFEYLFRLDALSSPSTSLANSIDEVSLFLEEDTGLAGFARLRLRSGTGGPWTEFIGTDGRLRRDLIKARVAALLAVASKHGAANGIDENLCITPGQVVDANVLDKILKQPQHCRIFYGPESSLPEMSEHRVVIVEDESCIVIKIGLTDPRSQQSLDVRVRLLIGIGVDSWPVCADYPRRVPLHHCDALLHYEAAQSGMYVVAEAPQQTLRCEDRPSLWRVRLPAAEMILRGHYSDESVPALTEAALMRVLEQLRGERHIDFSIRCKGSLRLVSRHILRTIELWSLERMEPDLLRNWAPDTLSYHVLWSLDELLRSLKCQNLRCYFQPRCNLMLQCTRGGKLFSDESYCQEARIIESYLRAVHLYSTEWLSLQPERCLSTSELLEQSLLVRWRRVVATLPRSSSDTQQRRGTTAVGWEEAYGTRQLQYLGCVIDQVLLARNCTLLQKNSPEHYEAMFDSEWLDVSESTENLIYVLRLVLRQAKDQMLIATAGATAKRNKKRRRRRLVVLQRNKRAAPPTKAERTASCAKAYFEKACDMLVDVVRKDRDTAYLDLDDPTIMAKALLKWLYFGMNQDKKVLAPVLRSHLNNLYHATLELCWHLECWHKRREAYNSEMRSLGAYCKLVSSREMLPANGIVDALSKGWQWADSVARMIERSVKQGARLRLIFVTPERVLRYHMKFANDQEPNSYEMWCKARNIGNVVRRSSMARTTLLTATDTLPGLENQLHQNCHTKESEATDHIALRDYSPLTLLVQSTSRRRGRQRGPGGFVPALVSLNKFRVLQEVAQVLPPAERTKLLDLTQRAKRESARRLRRASCPDPARETGQNRQLYTPRSETNLLDEKTTTTIDDYSPGKNQRRIVLERQLQLHQEISEIRDTLTRGLRSRSQLPSVWNDPTATMSSWGSRAGTLGTTTRSKKHRAPVWNPARGTSPLWNSVSCSSTFTKMQQQDPSRSDEPTFKVSDRSSNDNWYSGGTAIMKMKNDDATPEQLPSWEVLERVLNEKFNTYEYHKSTGAGGVLPPPFDDAKDTSLDYVLISNDTKESSKKQFS